MTKWAKSLIRLSSYEVETLQKRLSEIVSRRNSVELRLTALEAEAAVEVQRAQLEPAFAGHLGAYLSGVKHRKSALQADIDVISTEERGAREALAKAFEERKKFEQVAELTRLQDLAKETKLENAALDELALRQAAAGA